MLLRTRGAIVTIVVAVLAAAACGGGDDETSATTLAEGGDFDEEAYVDAAAGGINLGDEEQARCLAQTVVGAIGLENLRSSGVTPEEFAQSEDMSELGVSLEASDAEALQAGFARCGDLIQAVIDGSQLVEPEAECLREHFDNDLFAESMVVGMLGVEPSQELIDAGTSAQQCAGE